jgi:hypothetical protein
VYTAQLERWWAVTEDLEAVTFSGNYISHDDQTKHIFFSIAFHLLNLMLGLYRVIYTVLRIILLFRSSRMRRRMWAGDDVTQLCNLDNTHIMNLTELADEHLMGFLSLSTHRYDYCREFDDLDSCRGI